MTSTTRIDTDPNTNANAVADADTGTGPASLHQRRSHPGMTRIVLPAAHVPAYALSPAVLRTDAPPIPKARAWAAAYAANPSPALGPLIDLSQGVPGTAPHPALLDALARAGADPATARYGPILGEGALRDALAREVEALYCPGMAGERAGQGIGAGNGAGVTGEDVAVTTGCNMAFMVLLLALCPGANAPGNPMRGRVGAGGRGVNGHAKGSGNGHADDDDDDVRDDAPGSSVILPCPAYFNYAMSMSLLGVQPEWIPCDPDKAFEPSIEAARGVLRRERARQRQRQRPGHGRRVRMILLTNPSNPTGCVLSPEKVREWYDLAKEYGVALVLDETYRDFVPPSAEAQEEDAGQGEGGVRGDGRGKPHGLFELEGWRDTLVSLGSFSKSYRIPGYRLGSIIAAPALLKHITTIADCMQICAPRIAQLALAPLLPALRADIVSSSLVLAARRDLFERVVASVPGWSVSSIGAYTAYVAFPAAYAHAGQMVGAKGKRLGSEDVGRLMGEKVGVVVLPGCFFVPVEAEVRAEEAHEGGEGAGEERGLWDKLREDRWLRFAVANVDDETVRQLGPRLRAMNRLMGVDDGSASAGIEQ